MTESTNFLDICFNNKHINKTDKQEILLLYTNLQTYNYNDVFSPDVIINLYKHQLCHNGTRTIIDKPKEHYLTRGTAIHKNKNRIFKLWITNKDNPYTNDVCRQMITEFYFNNIYFNSVTDNILIVPETYKHGKVILEENNEILYFYEMEYYDSKKYILDSINNLDDEHKAQKLKYFYSLFTNGFTALRNMESRILISRPTHERILDSLEDLIETVNQDLFIYNDKCVTIDFGSATRYYSSDDRSKPTPCGCVYKYMR